MRWVMDDNRKRLWGVKGLCCEHAPYMNLAIAVVEQALQDVRTASRLFAKHGEQSSPWVITRAALAWRWMSDPNIECRRLSFREISDGCGTDWEVALDRVDELAETFPAGFRRRLESELRRLDIEARKRVPKLKIKRKVEVSGG